MSRRTKFILIGCGGLVVLAILLGVAVFAGVLIARSGPDAPDSTVEQRGNADNQPAPPKHAPAKPNSDGAAATGDLAVGETATTDAGNKITVHSYEPVPPPDEFSKPEAGFEFAAADVEGCAGPNAEPDSFSVDQFDFGLQVVDQWVLLRYRRRHEYTNPSCPL